MRELSSTEIMLSPEAAHEWKALEQAIFLHRSVFESDEIPVVYRNTELADGWLELAVEVQEQPFPHGMFLRIPPKHWRKTKGDA